MRPAELGSLSVYRGESWSWTIENVYNGVALDMTGFGDEWTSQTREALGSTEALTVTVDITDAATGKIVLTLDQEDTTSVIHDRMGFDVFATDTATSRRLPVYSGTLVFSGAYTRV